MSYIQGKKWYYFLTSKREQGEIGLFDVVNINECANKVLVSMRSSNGHRYFTLFENHIDFYNYSLTFAKNHRAFYETIPGQFSQKPHFDIDFPISDETANIDFNRLIENLVESIIKVFDSYQLNLNVKKDILIYSSHGKTKRSFHVIIDHFCHSDHNEAKYFYNEVIKVMD
jgi:hypothetical protein